ncbi:hypothetical protein GCM10007940_06380 [Portibacter lacus]|uniref:Uncharacterized protein n=2 Tax=Portibacter lacus TaxID=1099794 RepID=A0AA37SNX3_9BACT|nr:hypothetical protein GCM10007940_06380 [Portibacter lacus]
MDKVRSISEKKGLEISEIAVAYDKRSSSLAKGLIIVYIPFIALIGYLFNIKMGIAFGKHIIFATHFFSFFLFYLVIISGVNYLIDDKFNKWFFVIPTILIIPVYYAIGFKTFYRSSWLAALWKGILAVFLILILTQFYRIGINFLSLYTLLIPMCLTP